MEQTNKKMVSLTQESANKLFENMEIAGRINFLENPAYEDDVYIVVGKNIFNEVKRLRSLENPEGEPK